jgi:hypothetical protein
MGTNSTIANTKIEKSRNWNQPPSRQGQTDSIYNDYEEQFGCLVPESRFHRVQGNETSSESDSVKSMPGLEEIFDLINRRDALIAVGAALTKS